eukprot:6204084-Pleurochrysis_carterae.AAC.2
MRLAAPLRTRLSARRASLNTRQRPTRSHADLRHVHNSIAPPVPLRSQSCSALEGARQVGRVPGRPRRLQQKGHSQADPHRQLVRYGRGGGGGVRGGAAGAGAAGDAAPAPLLKASMPSRSRTREHACASMRPRLRVYTPAPLCDDSLHSCGWYLC